MIEIILIGSSILVISNVLLRFLFKDKATNISRAREYEEGYRRGYSHTKLYFQIFSKLPSNQWLNDRIHMDLSTRRKLLNTINNKINR
tara:strand:+ start:48 stop:311 length:264 start_codon:yes stop_codon:yes gene_type:complete